MDWFGDTFFIISIHAPLAGRDGLMILLMRAPPHFNPRAPCGARQHERIRLINSMSISTHAPLAGRDELPYDSYSPWSEFQPTRPLRGATVVQR